jgi:hypothetical protein
MHTAIANWAAWWNDGRSKTDLALPYVAVYVDDANVGQCYHTGNPDYSLAMACAGGAGSPNGGTADLTFAPSSHPHMVSPFITLHPGLDANSLATSVCHRMGSVMGLADNPAADSCMSPSPPRATFLWYNPTDGSGALSLYDSHAD